jgi:hypothetical protein
MQGKLTLETRPPAPALNWTSAEELEDMRPEQPNLGRALTRRRRSSAREKQSVKEQERKKHGEGCLHLEEQEPTWSGKLKID